MVTLLGFSTTLFSQQQTVGLRFGDLTGISYTRGDDRGAWEVNLGRTYLKYHNRKRSTEFDQWLEDQTFWQEANADPSYEAVLLRSDIEPELALQVRRLFRGFVVDPRTNSATRMSWYAGGGAQLRYERYSYIVYEIKPSPVPESERYIQVINDPSHYLGLGMDVTAGLDYALMQFPFVVFLDFSMYNRISNFSFEPIAHAGFGARYVFRQG